MTLKVTQGHQNRHYLMGHILLTISHMSLSPTISKILPLLQCVCDLEISFSFNMTAEITGYLGVRRLQTAKLVLKCHSTGAI